ncbi:MAG: DUF1330 domain-containing protein [Desulfatiglandales bacterium]
MSYYFVANYDVTDQKMYEQYVQAVGPTLMQHDAKVLVVDHEPNDIEGKSGHTLIVLEFESEAAAMWWYNSPEYQAVVNFRIDASKGWLRGAPQFVMPA